ncbi:hypothetical protein [Streptomyces sp. NPDC006477]|uniref:hypothetical protein n=1 Tax=Streptomyces sp. NPDC006477 TaxID=3364747 RepID=UPI00369DA8EC
MTSTPEQQPADRLDAAAINERIRALWAGGALSPEGEKEYRHLLIVWAEAMRDGQQLAA